MNQDVVLTRDNAKVDGPQLVAMHLRAAALALVLWMSLVAPAAAVPAGPAAEEPAAVSDESEASELPRSKRSVGDDSATLAPMGITDGRSLSQGEWALSYRYSLVHSDDMRNRTHRDTTNSLLQRFGETPRKRDREVHLFGVSYAPHSRVTLSVKLPVIQQKTRRAALTGGVASGFTSESSGLGDLEVRALVPFMRKNRESLQVEMGISAPTGSIHQHDRGASGRKETLSFPQQLGSGTVDLLPGLLYRGRWNSLSWGFVARGKFRVYENSRNYRLGDEYLLATWLAQSWTDWMSTSLRLSWNRFRSAHPGDDTTLGPETDPKRQAGEFLDLGPGVNFEVPLPGSPRFGVEMNWPFFQTLDGPQLERDWQLTAGWQWAF